MTTSETLPEAGLRDRLLGMTTATATAMLDKRGYPNQFMLGAHAIQRGKRACGRAATVRFGPARPDLMHAQDERAQDALWLAVESAPRTRSGWRSSRSSQASC